MMSVGVDGVKVDAREDAATPADLGQFAWELETPKSLCVEYQLHLEHLSIKKN